MSKSSSNSIQHLEAAISGMRQHQQLENATTVQAATNATPPQQQKLRAATIEVTAYTYLHANITVAPFRNKTREVSNPRPLLAPVTNTVLFSMEEEDGEGINGGIFDVL